MPLWGALTKKLPDVSPKIVQLDSRHIENQKTYAQLYHKIDRSLSKREKSDAVQNPKILFWWLGTSQFSPKIFKILQKSRQTFFSQSSKKFSFGPMGML